MHAADDHVVVPAAVIVVEVHMEQPVARPFGQHDGFGHVLAADEAVPRVDRHAHVPAAGFLSSQNRIGHARMVREVARFFSDGNSEASARIASVIHSRSRS